jgi:hypothetical protein
MAAKGTSGYVEFLVTTILAALWVTTLCMGLLSSFFINRLYRDSATNSEVNNWAVHHFRNCDSLLHNSIKLMEKLITSANSDSLLV